MSNEASNENQSDDQDFEDDFVIEDEDHGNVQQTVNKLRSRLKKCEKEKQEYLQGWQRAKADLVNAKREFSEKQASTSDMAKKSLIEDLLRVLDSFEMAFADKETWESMDENWRVGIEHIHRELTKSLHEHGLEAIKPMPGDEFDPKLHEPVETTETDEEDRDDTIEKLLQKGYLLKERILRPAKVSVYKLDN